MKNKEVLCCYCGENTAVTRDHVPPKGIFNKPRPANLITVPACQKCNNEASVYDERFKVYLGMHVGRKKGAAEVLSNSGAMPTIRYNNKIKTEIIEKMKPMELRTPNGLYLGRAASVLWDSEAHDNVVERIARGLFFYHFGRIIGKDADLKVYYFDKSPKFDYAIDETVDIGNGAFSYSYAEAKGGIYSSVWLFQFYKAHWAAGFVIDK